MSMTRQSTPISQLGVLLCQSRFKNHLLLNLIPYNPTDVTEAFLPPTPGSILLDYIGSYFHLV
eukprot:gene37292-50329_t